VTQDFPAKLVLDITVLAERVFGQATLNDTDQLPYCLILLNAAELGDLHVAAHDAVQVVSNEINNHEVFRNLLHAPRQRFLSDRARDARPLADSPLDGSKLRDRVWRTREGKESLWRIGDERGGMKTDVCCMRRRVVLARSFVKVPC
jgi:hypothetical protein